MQTKGTEGCTEGLRSGKSSPLTALGPLHDDHDMRYLDIRWVGSGIGTAVLCSVRGIRALSGDTIVMCNGVVAKDGTKHSQWVA